VVKESVRTADGPRQRTLCHLGELNSSAQARWRTVEVFNDQGEEILVEAAGVGTLEATENTKVLDSSLFGIAALSAFVRSQPPIGPS
jgi:hypothetical protein